MCSCREVGDGEEVVGDWGEGGEHLSKRWLLNVAAASKGNGGGDNGRRRFSPIVGDIGLKRVGGERAGLLEGGECLRALEMTVDSVVLVLPLQELITLLEFLGHRLR